LIIVFLFLIFLSFISAGPYGPGNSMDLKYKILDGKIIYGYGDGVKYETSLRPKDASKNWKPAVRGKVVGESWEEIKEMRGNSSKADFVELFCGEI